MNDQQPYAWNLTPGDQILRTELHQLYGGRPQGGISPSAQSPNVFIFSDPATGEQHGYFDGWHADGCFHYTGEGQRGDQRMVSGNATILNHEQEGRALRVFDGSGGTVTYVDEFRLDPANPSYETDAPETGGGPIRKVLVFRLRPLTTDPQPPQPAPTQEEPPLPPTTGPLVESVPVEEQHTERAVIDPAREPYESERREQRLVLALDVFLTEQGHNVARLKIRPEGEAKPLFSDLFDETASVLFEAKGSVTREAVRMAIGQLADYSRFLPDETRKAMLLPERPRDDLLALASTQGIAVVWPSGAEYSGEPDIPWAMEFP